MMKILVLLSMVALTGCVSTTTHYGKRPPLEQIQIGMSTEQVRAVMGKPARVASQGDMTYLQYGWDDPWDGRIGATEEYFVRMINGKVESFGQKGDFDSTKNPTADINIRTDSKIQTTVNSNGDLFTELTKLKSLLDSGAITQAEYDELKARAISASK